MDSRTPEPREDDLLDYTLEVFQPRSERRLTREDAREIVHNVTGFFRVLMDWDRAAKAASTASDEPRR